MLLEGLRILAVEQYGAGPFGTQFLADLGAEVIKVEDPADGGDIARSVGPHFMDSLPEGARSVFFQGLNRGKKSLALDLKRPEGRDVFRRLARDSQAVASNLRGDVPDKVGITYRHLAQVNPRIVCAHLTGYGRDNARATWPGYDFLMQAEAGYFHLTGEPEGAPARCGLSLIDLMTGVTLGLALVSGVRHAERTGRGRDVDVSLFDLALHNLNYIGHWYLNKGAVTGRQPRSAHASLVPCQTYRTADGWIYLMCNKEKFWGELCRRIGRPEWERDPRFLSFRERLAHRDLLTGLLDGELSRHTTAEWLAEFAGSVPAAPILDVAQALESPWVRDSDRIEAIGVPGGTQLRRLRTPVRTQGVPPPAGIAPSLGADTDALLLGAGYSAAAIAALREARVIA